MLVNTGSQTNGVDLMWVLTTAKVLTLRNFVVS